MSVEIHRLGAVFPYAITPNELMKLLEDFKARADGSDRDGWQASDMARIMVACASSDRDAAWLVFDDGNVIGFQILAFSPSLQGGRIEGQIVAFYLKPGSPLSVAPKMVDVMKEHARREGAFRIVAGTQRTRNLRAFERLGGYALGVMLVIPLQENECRLQQSFQL